MSEMIVAPRAESYTEPTEEIKQGWHQWLKNMEHQNGWRGFGDYARHETMSGRKVRVDYPESLAIDDIIEAQDRAIADWMRLSKSI